MTMASTDITTYKKNVLKGLLADDKLELLQNNLQDITATDELKAFTNEVILNAGRLSDYRKTVNNGTASNDELRIMRNQIRLSFLNIIDGLPDEMTVNKGPSVKSVKLMTEHRFKSWMLGIMLVGKLLMILFVVFQTDTGGLSKDQGLSVMALLLPALTAYLGALAADVLRRRYDLFPTGNDKKIISKSLQRMTFVLLPVYFLCLFILINRYAMGHMNEDGDVGFAALITWLAIVESGFGLYIGQVVYGLFREK
jgi:hypothetical protein